MANVSEGLETRPSEGSSAGMGSLGVVRHAFQSSVLSGLDIAVLQADWQEELNAPYRASIEIEIGAADQDALVLLGENAILTLTREGGLERRLTGLITEVEHLEADNPEHTYARVVLSPALALLALSQQSRIFQEKSVPEIVQAVLDEALAPYGREIEVSVTGSHPKREYCVQYQESDLAFVDRLVEEEGISYAFEHDGETERLVFRDSNAFSRASIAGASIPFDPRVGADMENDEVIRDLARVSVPRTTKVTVRDRDWTSPSTLREASSGDDGRESYEFGLGRSLTISDYSGERYGAHDADRQAPLRLEALTRDAIVLEGQSRVIGLVAGTTIQIAGHSSDLDGEYLLMEVDHRSSERQGERDRYSNRFRAIPNAVPYRPIRRRPKPHIASVQTAIVTGPSGEEIHTDSHGRVKVQFHWDLAGKGDDTLSCWVRVSQAWAGPGWGFLFIPRVGMEVVVHFMNGDPDRPVVQGCLYNSEHRPPYPLPAEKTKSTIKSSSYPGGAGFNELRFEDLAGSEQIYIHAQRDMDEKVDKDHTTKIGNDQTNKVGSNQVQKVKGNQTEQVDGSSTMTIDGNRKVAVTKNVKETILSGEKREIAGAQSEMILSGGETRFIIGTLDEYCNSTELRSVSGGQTELVLVKGNHTIKSAHSETISGSLTQNAVSSYSLSSFGGTMLVKASLLNTVIASGGMNVRASSITVDCGLRMQIDPFWFGCDSTLNSTFGGVGITAAAVNVSGIAVSVAQNGLSVGLNSLSLGLYGVKVAITACDITLASKAFSAMSPSSIACFAFGIHLN